MEATDHALRLRAKEEYRYSPYKYKSPNLLNDDQGLHTATADERELLLDLGKRHTITCMPTSARKGSPRALEYARFKLLGDSFQCAVMTHLMQPLMVHLG